MTPGRFKAARAAGRVPLGHMILEFPVRAMPRLLESAGADFAVIDLEHAPTTIGQVADLLEWFRSTEVEPFVRIPQIDYHWIARTLDAGARGIMAPDVKTPEAARELVAVAKYAPEGRRGVFFGGSLTRYAAVDPADFKQKSGTFCERSPHGGTPWPLSSRSGNPKWQRRPAVDF